MNIFKSKNSMIYLIGALAVVLTALYLWNKNTFKQEDMMPQQDTHWKQLSGENEFRNHSQDNSNNTNTNLSYTQIPMQSDTRFLTGMNQYLWDKHKKDDQYGCQTCC